MTTGGGTNNAGTVFSLKTDGTGFQSLFSFSATNGSPFGSLTVSGSTLYGMAQGGPYGDGTIFSISTTGGSLQTLFSFSGANGDAPNGSLTLAGSTLYGMTFAGGVPAGWNTGTIFSINTDGSGFQSLLSFSVSSTGGTGPLGNLTLGGGTLYGMTNYGGAYNYYGTAFSLTLPTSSDAWSQSGGGSWNNPGNWNGNVVPGYNPQDAAIFGTVIGSNTATVTLDGSWIIGSLIFTTTGGGSYTIGRSAGDTTSTLTLMAPGPARC